MQSEDWFKEQTLRESQPERKDFPENRSNSERQTAKHCQSTEYNRKEGQRDGSLVIASLKHQA